MLKFLASFILFFTTLSLSAQCGFPTSTNGTQCSSAEYICNLDGTTGTLPDPGTNVPNFPNVCNGIGTIENAVWYAFIPCESTVSITICPSDCTPGQMFIGMQAAIYSSCSSNSAIECLTTGTESCFTLTNSTYIPGFTYYLLLDGYGGSVCDFDITVNEGLNTDEFDLSMTGPNVISGPTDACVPECNTFTYSVPDCEVTATGCSIPGLSAFDLACYEWTITPNTFSYIGSSDEQIIDVKFDAPGDYTISVERFLHPYIENCSTGSCDDPADIIVEISFIDTVINNATIICPGEIAMICGNPVGLPGVYECLDEDLCILTIDTLVFNSAQTVNLGNIFLCPDECYTLENTDYCDRQDYAIESNDNCAITYLFSIKDLSIIITPPDDYPILNCNITSVFVSPTVQTNYEESLNYSYKDELGNIISSEIFAEITEPGDYTFYAFSLDNLPGCIDSIQFTINEDDKGPQITIEAEGLTCSDTEAILTVNPIDNVVAFTWTGVEVNNPNAANAFASEPGTYYISAEGENGCLTIDSIEVEEVLLPAEIDIEWDDLDCNIAQTTLKYISDVSVDSILWQGPVDFMSKLDEAVAMNAGVYTLSLFSGNGCDYTEIFEVLGNYQDPEFTEVLPEEWACLTNTLQIEVAYGDTSDFEFSWFTEQGVIESTNTTEDNIQVASTGQYYVEITDAITGCSVIDTIDVIANDQIPTDVELESASPLCSDIDDGMISIGNVTGGIAPFNYFVNNTEITDLLLENLAPDNYEISIIDDNGCELKRVIIIDAPLAIVADIEGPTEANFNDLITFIAEVDENLFDIDEINWYDETGAFIGTGNTVSFTMTKKEIITMEVIDINGCVVIKTREIELDENYDYFLPNIFSPNDDGINDFFGIYPQDLPGVIREFQIYDRWGNKVFTVSNIDNNMISQNWGWDGTFNGSPVNSGVYVFYVLAETLGVEKELKGSVTLVR